MIRRVLPWVLLTQGCGLFDLFGEPEPNCTPRTAYYEDADGDGVGDVGGALYLGCEAPEGYVEVAPDTDAPVDTDTDAVDTDTDGPVDTDTDPDSDTDLPTDTDVDTDTDTDV